MKAAFRLSLEGLIRALRSRMHEMAEELETSYAAERERSVRIRSEGWGKNDDEFSNT
jgi:hypothetical protein